MNREELMVVVAAFALQPAHNPGEQRQRAADAKATAEELLNLFELPGDSDHARAELDLATHTLVIDGEPVRTALQLRALYDRAAMGMSDANEQLAELARMGVTKARVDELEQLGAANAKRIAELEQDLEKATAPKGSRR